MRTSFLSLLLLLSAPLGAQRVTLTAPVDLLQAPGGRVLATLRAGASVATGPTRTGFVQVTVQGYVAASLLGPARDSFPVTIKDASAHLRVAGQGGAQSVASLRQGMGLGVLQRTAEWVQVSRTGWIREAAVRPAPTTAATKTQSPVATATKRAPPVTRTVPPATKSSTASPKSADTRQVTAQRPDEQPRIADSSDLVSPKGGILRDAPNGNSVATLGDSARMQALFRERGWVRVRIEGWVRDADVTEADTALRAALLPADLRADPLNTRGKLVRWDVQKLAIQTADPLQRDLAQNEPYMLARGPGSDHPLLYLSLPPSLLASARNLPPLGYFTITARVRNGRSSPGGVPILDVVSLSAK